MNTYTNAFLPLSPRNLNHPQAGWRREPHHLEVQVQRDDPSADAHVPIRKPRAGQVDDEVFEKVRDVGGGRGQVNALLVLLFGVLRVAFDCNCCALQFYNKVQVAITRSKKGSMMNLLQKRFIMIYY